MSVTFEQNSTKLRFDCYRDNGGHMAVGNLRLIGSKNTDPHAVIDDQEVRPDDVFAKTQSGVDEVRRTGGSTIPPKLRTVLMLIDGRTPFESFKSTLQTYGDVTQLFSILRDLGLIVKTTGGDAARDRGRSPRAPSSSPLGSETQALRQADSYPTQSSLSAITQMPDMMARIALAEQAPGVYSTGNTQNAMPANPPPAYYPPPAAPPAIQPPPTPRNAPQSGMSDAQLESIKSTMIRDVSAILGADAGLVISKIQGCRTQDDLFASMMGIKKIITIYADRSAAEKFATRYQTLSF
jgi:hypothetical protein